mmetsp:Transcript_20027/g.37982  ORF Transcript_20027/g.37982 Transcript_20027/m.37982 type:complete len:239 (-) Transcript_20027:977-1693(-)
MGTVSTSMDANVASLFASKSIANASKTLLIVVGIAAAQIARTFHQVWPFGLDRWATLIRHHQHIIDLIRRLRITTAPHPVMPIVTLLVQQHTPLRMCHQHVHGITRMLLRNMRRLTALPNCVAKSRTSRRRWKVSSFILLERTTNPCRTKKKRKNSRCTRTPKVNKKDQKVCKKKRKKLRTMMAMLWLSWRPLPWHNSLGKGDPWSWKVPYHLRGNWLKFLQVLPRSPLKSELGTNPG